jgi:hypothetical protein
MRFAIQSIVFGFAAISASALMPNVTPAIAQAEEAQASSFPIQAGNIVLYARYYAPYAIQAATAYSCYNEEFEKCVERFQLEPAAQSEPEADADVNYAVSKLFTDPTAASHARKAFRAWRYQFGSDGSHISCLDPADSECQRSLPRWFTGSFGAGPLFQVWGRSQYPHTEHDKCSEFSVAFRGTQLTGTFGVADWVFGNVAPVSQLVGDDYYHQLRRNIDAIIRKIETQPCYRRAGGKPPQLVSVGHSLGGGLAEFAALANKRIAKVFSFDPSPVTGAYILDKKTRKSNSDGLTIDRIYQYGEVLSYLRKAKQGYPPSDNPCNPRVRTVHVDAFGGTHVQLHDVSELAVHFINRSYTDYVSDTGKIVNAETPYLPPDVARKPDGAFVSTTDCVVRYRYPPTDEDQNENAVASANAESVFRAQIDREKQHAAQERRVYAYNIERRRSIENMANSRMYALAATDKGIIPIRARAANGEVYALAAADTKIIRTASALRLNSGWLLEQRPFRSR